MPEINHQLLLWATGPWKDTHLPELLSALSDRGCVSHDMRVSQLQDGFATHMVVAGNWSSIGKLETALPGLAEKLGLQIGASRIAARPAEPELRPFAVELSAPQQADLLPALVQFFAHHGVSVAEVVSQPYQAHMTQAPMVNMQLVVLVGASAQPPALRESFMDFCDDYHADGIFDPIKN